MVTQRIVICPSYYLCVVVKERPEAAQRRFSRPPCRASAKFRSDQADSSASSCRWKVVGVTGFEPVTLRLSSACSNQLSYTPGQAGGARGLEKVVRNPELVELRRLELPTYSLQSYRSTN